jgi:hypothetical protein
MRRGWAIIALCLLLVGGVAIEVGLHPLAGSHTPERPTPHYRYIFENWRDPAIRGQGGMWKVCLPRYPHPPPRGLGSHLRVGRSLIAQVYGFRAKVGLVLYRGLHDCREVEYSGRNWERQYRRRLHREQASVFDLGVRR